jgi:ADP-ribosyl-[dinitrogen reductase] hydrolase
MDDWGARDRAVGALVGLACGDAVGTTLEFRPPGTFEPIDDMVGGGPFGLRPGQWTDDTSLALCLAESILDTGTLDLADQLRRYGLWRRHGYLASNGRCFDIGHTTSSQLRRFERTGEPVDLDVDQEAAANGSLMRLAPVPVRWHRDPEEAAARAGESSRTTHPADRPVDACRVLGAMVAALIGGTSADEVLDPGFWRWGALHPEVEEVARGSWARKEPPEIRGSGYCVHALEAALWAVGGAVDVRDAILRAANLGDDADTTAAIAGQLAGARWGAAAIPASWRGRLAMGPRIESLADNLHRAGCGTGDAPAWEHDEALHAWWVEPGGVLAGEYPGHPDPQRARAKLDLLVDAGIRTIVDLTTADDGLTPYDGALDAVATTRALELDRHRVGIPDLGTTDHATYDDLVARIRRAADRGGVYVHCWGGVGRTGTVVGCMLAADGLDSAAVLDRLRELRAGTRKARRPCPETEEQGDVIRARAPR